MRNLHRFTATYLASDRSKRFIDSSSPSPRWIANWCYVVTDSIRCQTVRDGSVLPPWEWPRVWPCIEAVTHEYIYKEFASLGRTTATKREVCEQDLEYDSRLSVWLVNENCVNDSFRSNTTDDNVSIQWYIHTHQPTTSYSGDCLCLGLFISSCDFFSNCGEIKQSNLLCLISPFSISGQQLEGIEDTNSNSKATSEYVNDGCDQSLERSRRVKRWQDLRWRQTTEEGVESCATWRHNTYRSSYINIFIRAPTVLRICLIFGCAIHHHNQANEGPHRALLCG